MLETKLEKSGRDMHARVEEDQEQNSEEARKLNEIVLESQKLLNEINPEVSILQHWSLILVRDFDRRLVRKLKFVSGKIIK